MNPGRVSPSVALAAYAEAWISGAKVVVFGDALSPLAERLVERGARHVQVYDADPARVAEASAASTLKQVAHAPLDLAGSSLRDGFFDVAIVEDLSGCGRAPKELLTLLVRALSRRGLALIGSRNPDVVQRLITSAAESEPTLGYYDLYDTVSQHFEEVRMLGQTPFVGSAIADFSAADANDVRIDTALLPGGAEEPEWFLALASALPVSPDAFSVIQLPLSELDLGRGRERAEAGAAPNELLDDKVRELEAALAELAAEGAREAEKHAAERAKDAERFAAERAREAEKLAAERQAAERARDAEKVAAERAREAEKLAAERARDAERLATERVREAERQTAERSREAEKLAVERTREAEKQAAERSRAGEKQERSRDAERRELEKTLGQKIQALEAELEKREEWLVGLEARAATADERADEAQAELEQLGKDQRKAKEQIARLEQQLDEERRAKRQLEEAGRAHKQELDKRDRRIEAEAQRVSELTSEAKGLGARVAELTQALTESEQKAKQSELSAKQSELKAKQSEQKAKQSAEAGDEEVQAELLALEALLKDRAAEVGRLTAALHDTARFGRQLILQLTELEANRAAVPPSSDVAELTRRNAELAADLEAARWTISSLEANVGDSPTPTPASGQRRDELPPAEPHASSGAD